MNLFMAAGVDLPSSGNGGKCAEVKRLTGEIEAAEREIDKLVYEAFDLTPEEIELLENSLEGQV